MPFFTKAGIDARRVTTRNQQVLGLSYAGFPFIPPVENPPSDVDGKLIRWNYQLWPGEMQDLIDTMFAGETPDLLLTYIRHRAVF